MRCSPGSSWRGPRCVWRSLSGSSWSDPDRASETLVRLADLGVAISLDDFGTGYSSLTYLRRLPVNEVKVDKSFVGNLTVDPEDRAIVRSIVDLSRTLGLATVAEGVENEATWEALAEMGCDAAQGWLLGYPMPAAAMTHWLQTHPPRDLLDARAVDGEAVGTSPVRRMHALPGA